MYGLSVEGTGFRRIHVLFTAVSDEGAWDRAEHYYAGIVDRIDASEIKGLLRPLREGRARYISVAVMDTRGRNLAVVVFKPSPVPSPGRKSMALGWGATGLAAVEYSGLEPVLAYSTLAKMGGPYGLVVLGPSPFRSKPFLHVVHGFEPGLGSIVFSLMLAALGAVDLAERGGRPIYVPVNASDNPAMPATPLGLGEKARIEIDGSTGEAPGGLVINACSRGRMVCVAAAPSPGAVSRIDVRHPYTGEVVRIRAEGADVSDVYVYGSDTEFYGLPPTGPLAYVKTIAVLPVFYRLNMGGGYVRFEKLPEGATA